jgi:thymidylate synthase (FAD)
MNGIANKVEVFVLAHTELHPGFYEYLSEYNRIWPSGYDSKLTSDSSSEIIDWKRDHPGEALAEMAGRICYDSFSGDGAGAGRKTNKSYINHIIEVGHGSVLEHATMTVLVKGASRGFTHEQVRHRVGTAYSQASTRYCDGDKFRFVMPSLVKQMIEEAESIGDEGLIKATQELYGVFEDSSKSIGSIYAKAIDATQELAERIYYSRFDISIKRDETALRKAVRSCARSLLPIGIEAPIVITQNYRQWRTALVSRGSEAAELEIREVYIKCLEILQELAPHIFGDFETFRSKDGTLACRTDFPKV